MTRTIHEVYLPMEVTYNVTRFCLFHCTSEGPRLVNGGARQYQISAFLLSFPRSTTTSAFLAQIRNKPTKSHRIRPRNTKTIACPVRTVRARTSAARYQVRRLPRDPAGPTSAGFPLYQRPRLSRAQSVAPSRRRRSWRCPRPSPPPPPPIAVPQRVTFR